MAHRVPTAAAALICILGATPCQAQTGMTFGLECPRKGTLAVVADPAKWADKCFAAINGRPPSPEYPGEASSDRRDLDLDGTPELLEIRGTGQALKQIFVFRETQSGFIYLGELHASRSVKAEKDDDGNPILLSIYRSGQDYFLQRHRYVDREFVLVDQTPLE